jgi:hypothetical protein
VCRNYIFFFGIIIYNLDLSRRRAVLIYVATYRWCLFCSLEQGQERMVYRELSLSLFV